MKGKGVLVAAAFLNEDVTCCIKNQHVCRAVKEPFLVDDVTFLGADFLVMFVYDCQEFLGIVAVDGVAEHFA